MAAFAASAMAIGIGSSSICIELFRWAAPRDGVGTLRYDDLVEIGTCDM
jgi:hypothetical protein